MRLVGKVATARANGTFLEALVPLARQARRALTLIRLLTRTVTQARQAAAELSRQVLRCLADAAGVIAAYRLRDQAEQRALLPGRAREVAARLDGRILALPDRLAAGMVAAMVWRVARRCLMARAEVAAAATPPGALAGVGISRFITRAP